MKNKYEFWKDWERKTKLEEAAIESVKAARRIILNNIPTNEIVTIFSKGSFPRRELNKKSDVDLVSILRTGRFLSKIKKLEKENKHQYGLPLNLGAYSLYELRTNKISKSNAANTPPGRFIRHFHYYPVIYGKQPDISKLYYRDDKSCLRGMVHAFRDLFIPGYESGKYSFSDIAKQVFWLTEWAERHKGKNPLHSWKKLSKLIDDENHIVHDSLKHRLKKIEKSERPAFMKKLNDYLNELEKLKLR